jgi:uncharacterized protein (TIGR03032 family)
VSEFELVRLAFHEVEASAGFTGFLAAEQATVALTCAGRLFLIGLDGEGSVVVTDCAYGLCTALEPAGPDTLYLATRYQIWRLENALPAGQRTPEGHDHLFVPQAAWTTGLLGVLDMARDGDGRLLFVNSRFSCLSRTSETLNFEPVWLPPFVSALAPEDRCHMTGVAMDGGGPAYVTCAAPTDAAEDWKGRKSDGGVVVDVASGDIVCRGLSMPHSPRLVGRRLWLANAGAGELGFVDLDAPRPVFEAVAWVPGFARGVAVLGGHAFVGCSRPPKEVGTFVGLPVQDRLDRDGAEPVCGVYVVDLDAGRVAHSVVLHGAGPELHDVAAVSHTRSATAVGVDGDDVQNLVTMPCPPAQYGVPSEAG